MKVGDMVFNHRTKKPCVITKIGQLIFADSVYDAGTHVCTVVNVGDSRTTFALMDRLEKMNDG